MSSKKCIGLTTLLSSSLATCRQEDLQRTILGQTKWKPEWFASTGLTGQHLANLYAEYPATCESPLPNSSITSWQPLFTYTRLTGTKKIDRRCFRCRNLSMRILISSYGVPMCMAAWHAPSYGINLLQYLSNFGLRHSYIQQKLHYGISRWQNEGKDSAWPDKNIPPYEDTHSGATSYTHWLLRLSKNNLGGAGTPWQDQ
jgi:hypothetical protein